jgi:hypothetical protein
MSNDKHKDGEKDSTNAVFGEKKWAKDGSPPPLADFLKMSTDVMADSLEKGILALLSKHHETLKLAEMMAKAKRNERK